MNLDGIDTSELENIVSSLSNEDIENLKNMAESLIFQCEKTMNEAGDKLTDADKAPVNAAIEKLKSSVAADNTDAIKADTDALQKAI